MSCGNSKSRLPLKHKKLDKHDEIKTANACTPTKNTNYLESDRDYSPVFLPCTQESLENVDVLWDWNSPQSKRNHRKQKRLHKAPSPKLPIKKQSSNNQLDNFDKLKQQLKAFQEEINPSILQLDEDNLETNSNNNNELFEDLFDDSIEDQLILVSQQIEEKFQKKEPNVVDINNFDSESTSKIQIPTHSNSPRNFRAKSLSSNTLLNIEQSPVRNVGKKTQFNFKARMHELKSESFASNDTFEAAINSIKEDDFNAECKPNSSTTGALKFKARSLSFGDQYANTKKKDVIIDDKLKEKIEKKRLEAKAKLKSKQKQETSDSETSPIKCSPEEIQNKRKQALAKLEAKRQHELIERNRQEAMKKLELSKKKVK